MGWVALEKRRKRITVWSVFEFFGGMADTCTGCVRRFFFGNRKIFFLDG